MTSRGHFYSLTQMPSRTICECSGFNRGLPQTLLG